MIARSVVAAVGLMLVSYVSAAPQGLPSGQPRYRVERVPATVKELRARYSAAQIAVVEALNRVDEAHLSSLKEMIVPEVWHDDLLTFSPFPTRLAGWGADRPKLLIVHQPSQAFAAYEAGRLIRWGPISSGRGANPTPQGLLHLNWRSPGRHSTDNPDWYLPWYFNFQNDRGLSFHQYALPGRPASHACVRLLERDARWLYDWGESWTLDARGWEVLTPGTPVLIVGCYAYAEAPPWQSPAWLAAGITLPADPDAVIRPCAGAA